MNDILAHHGIKGQRWGFRRWQYLDGTLTPEGRIRYGRENIENSTVKNVKKWGGSEETNVLYITAFSGAGKTTTARLLANKGDTIISLDGYYDHSSFAQAHRDKKFTKYLDKNVPEWRRVAGAKDVPGKERGIDVYGSYEHQLARRKIRDCIEQYGASEFKKEIR